MLTINHIINQIQLYTLRKQPADGSYTSNFSLGDYYETSKDFKLKENNELTGTPVLAVVGQKGKYLIMEDENAFILNDSGGIFEVVHTAVQRGESDSNPE